MVRSIMSYYHGFNHSCTNTNLYDCFLTYLVTSAKCSNAKILCGWWLYDRASTLFAGIDTRDR